jgi:membrane glycosyltransferase
MFARRLVFLIFVLDSTATASSLMADMLGNGGFTELGLAVLILFTISFAWIATAFWTACLGFLVRLVGGDPAGLAVSSAGADAPSVERCRPCHRPPTSSVA